MTILIKKRKKGKNCFNYLLQPFTCSYFWYGFIHSICKASGIGFNLFLIYTGKPGRSGV